jgi:hypothetical protein
MASTSSVTGGRSHNAGGESSVVVGGMGNVTTVVDEIAP